AMENGRKMNKGLIDDFVEDLENENFSGIIEVIEVINSVNSNTKKDDKKDLQSEQKNNDESLSQQNKNNSNDNEENPWLQTDTAVTSKILNHKNNKRIKSLGENKSDKLISKTKKHQLKNQIKEDIVEIDESKKKEKKKKKNVTFNNNINHTTKIDENLSDSNDENDEAIKNFVHIKNSTAFSHRELVARAFANDNVVD
ncbi:10254_t:CDS:2, partial [Dentiscutata erythropus]